VSPAASEYAWWASLNHGGLLIAPSRLAQFFPEDVAPLAPYVADKLRRDVIRAAEANGDALAVLLDTVLEEALGLGRNGAGRWVKGPEVGPEWSERALSGETVKPRRVWRGPEGFVLPVFVDTDVSRIGLGRGRRSHTRVIEWLRKRDRHLALLTNGRQWRLVHAGLDTDAFAEWDTDLWFEEGVPGPQVTALRLLLGPSALTPLSDGAQPPLLAAIQATRQGQAELSAALGERVRRAVELLIQEHRGALDSLDETVTPTEIYIAATRVVMRLVVVLFAEARDLLPRDNPLYHGSYGLQGLRESLERAGGGASEERLRHHSSAWPRILALFRLIHDGSAHPQLPVTRYGGGLFRPGNSQARDAVLRALTAFESPEHGPSDAAIRRILDLLTRSRVRVRQGRGATYVETPVDFSDLSSEYIGILYEGLLDWENAEAHAIPYAREQVERFSPRTKAILELSEKRDLEILEKIYANSVLLGDDGPDGWGIKYATEFHMTNDSELFPPRPVWEAKGYRPDEYGRWLKGGWRPGRPPGERWQMEPGVVLSVDAAAGLRRAGAARGAGSGGAIGDALRGGGGGGVGVAWIHVDDIEDVALPLYEGRMIGQFDFSQKGWVSSKGRSAVWREIPWSDKRIEPQYLMGEKDYLANAARPHGTKVAHMRIGSATNARSVVAAALDGFPTGDTAAVFWTDSLFLDLVLTAVLNSFVFDWVMRLRLGGLHLDYHVFEANPLPRVALARSAELIAQLAARLSFGHGCWRRLSPRLRDAGVVMENEPLSGPDSGDAHRLIHAQVDALVASLFGLDQVDLAWILRDCAHPSNVLRSNVFTRTLSPKGFWRVDGGYEPETRLPGLVLREFEAGV
jgi:hypothetical protein